MIKRLLLVIVLLSLVYAENFTLNSANPSIDLNGITLDLLLLKDSSALVKLQGFVFTVYPGSLFANFNVLEVTEDHLKIDFQPKPTSLKEIQEKAMSLWAESQAIPLIKVKKVILSKSKNSFIFGAAYCKKEKTVLDNSEATFSKCLIQPFLVRTLNTRQKLFVVARYPYAYVSS